MNNLLLIQVCIADYRNKFIEDLLTYEGVKIQVGEKYFEETTVTSAYVKKSKNVKVVKNHFFIKNKICWQSLDWSDVISAKYVVGELNPRILSTWLLLLIRFILCKKTFLWGHAWARVGRGSKTEWVRHLMRKISSGLLFYTNQQRQEFLEEYPSFNKKLVVAPNSVFYRDEMVPVPLGNNFIYVGRLVKSKKVDILINGFLKYAENHSQGILHIVGSGDQLNHLVEMSSHSAFVDRIIFHGHIAEVQRLKNLYSDCAASVSPGYVGLSMTQSLSFGVPMIISREEPHSPEIEAMIEGFNGSFFETDDINSLALQMEYWVNHVKKSENLSENIVDDCKKRYSVEKMVAGFLELCHE